MQPLAPRQGQPGDVIAVQVQDVENVVVDGNVAGPRRGGVDGYRSGLAAVRSWCAGLRRRPPRRRSRTPGSSARQARRRLPDTCSPARGCCASAAGRSSPSRKRQQPDAVELALENPVRIGETVLGEGGEHGRAPLRMRLRAQPLRDIGGHAAEWRGHEILASLHFTVPDSDGRNQHGLASGSAGAGGGADPAGRRVVPRRRSLGVGRLQAER